MYSLKHRYNNHRNGKKTDFPFHERETVQNAPDKHIFRICPEKTTHFPFHVQQGNFCQARQGSSITEPQAHYSVHYQSDSFCFLLNNTSVKIYRTKS